MRDLKIAPFIAGDDGTVTGTEFADTLLGDPGPNVLDGQRGNDFLQGDLGADFYVVKPGMGRDTIVDDGEGDALKLAPGLAFRHLTVAKEGDDLLVGILGTEDGVRLKDYYLSNQPWQLEDDAGQSKSLAQLLAEAGSSSSRDSIDLARDAWLAGIRNFAFSQLGDYASVSGDLVLQDNGEFQNYYTVRMRSSASNSPTISNVYQWHDVGDLGDFGIDPVVRKVRNVEISAENIGLQPASAIAGGFGNGFYDQFLVDYSRTDAQGNPLVLGLPDGSGHWSASYVHLQALSAQTPPENRVGTSFTAQVSIDQTNSISGLAAELIAGGAGNNLFTVFGFVAIDAGAGDDVLNATGWLFWDWDSPAGGDFLYGADGNDNIFGSDAPDVLIGGNGIDYLAGTGGHDTYKIFATDTGTKIIDESVVHYSVPASFVSGWSNSGWFSHDVVEFSAGIALNDLQFEWGEFDSTSVDDSGVGRRYDTLNLSWAPGKEVQIVLPDFSNPDVVQRAAQYSEQSFGIEEFKFADGTVVSVGDMLARAIAAIGAERDQSPALLSPITDQPAYEDSRFEFTVPAGTFFLPEEANYSANLASGNDLPAWLHFDPATLIFSGTPVQGDVGTIDVRLTATVGGLSADDTFVIEVANVNDAPHSTGSLGQRAATQDQPFAFIISDDAFTDEDPADHLSFAAPDVPAWLDFDPITRSFTGTPGNADAGTTTIFVTARDDAGASVSNSFDVIVANVNDAPTPADDLAFVTEDDAVEAFGNVLSNDGDIDSGTQLAVHNPGILQGRYGSLDLTVDGSFRYTLNNDLVQSLRESEIAFDDFGYTAWDGMAASTPATLRIAIGGRNDAPITAADMAMVVEDVRPFASGNVLANDFDVDADSTLALADAGNYEDPTTLLGRLTLHSDGTYEYVLNNAAAQMLGEGEVVHERFSYVATDGFLAGRDGKATGTLEVAIRGANDAPLVSQLISELLATEDRPFNSSLPAGAFVDVDRHDELTYAATRPDGTSLPDWLSFDEGTLTLRGTPSNQDVGLASLQVVATDKAGASASQSFVLLVANINDAPIVENEIADHFVEAGTAFNFTVPQATFRDIDAADALTLSARAMGGGALPSWLNFNPTTSSFSGTPQTADIGVSGVNLRATDRSGASVSSDFVLAVTAKAGTR
ncbi:MAG TPA: putative Ig domain-containing protein, partial [Gemmatimonadaceae bacterium]